MDELQLAKRQTVDRLREDLLDTEATKRMTRAILKSVQDPRMHPSIAAKAASAIAAGKLSPHEIREVLEAMDRNRRSIKNRGGYFVTCLKRLFQAHEIAWR